MVLEHLFPEDWLERKLRYAFILAVVYSTIAIVISRLLFPANSGIVSVAITSLLLIPYLKKLLVREERKELKERSFKVHRFFIDNWPAIKVYGVLFLGVYFTYMFYTFLIPQFLPSLSVGSIFREQLSLEVNLRGGAFSLSTFYSIFSNNWWVLLACFLLALIAGDGALFFIIWNASSWGTIFGYRALQASINGGAFGGWTNLLLIVLITFPHVILEGGAYIVAAIAGGLMSDDITSKRKAMESFIYYFLAAIVGFVILFFFLKLFLISKLVITITSILTILILLHLLSFVFADPAHKEVFKYNYYLFLIALLLFIVGALIETLVVGNSSILNTIYSAAL